MLWDISDVPLTVHFSSILLLLEVETCVVSHSLILSLISFKHESNKFVSFSTLSFISFAC
eukprot:m.8921 g.8921  ORF g.8921 m.8921 type:complete len:60 (-) comp3301_c0_seq1:1056-1235(-)